MRDFSTSPGDRLFRFHPISAATIVNAAPDFALSAGFLISWIAPYTFGKHTISRFVTLVLLEFSALIAGIIVSPLIRMVVYFFGEENRANSEKTRANVENRASIRDRWRKWFLRDLGALVLQILAVGYSAFAIMLAIVVILVLRNPSGIYSSSLWWFGLLLLNRTFASIFSTEDPATEFARLAPMFGCQILSYIVLFGLAMTLPLPRLGIGATVMAVQWPSAAGHSGEIFNDQPWRFIAWGAAYYAAIAIAELFGLEASVPE